ncbi:chaplin family protein [Streptomyces sp. NPDC058467]|uniref:chaplin family protein n=1 Tax=Streptomyces sp. NPDC058467 TaxID=3346513 RepID=UPI00365F4724
MKRVTRNGLIAAAAASGALAVTMPAHADSAADGAAAGSPGLISGNTIQLPVHVPVNVCGNTVNVVGLLNPAAGNSCANESGGDGQAASTRTSGGAVAHSSGKDSPGVLSGNGLQLPVHLPMNVSGNSVSVVGVGNGAVGNESTNTSDGRPPEPAPKPAAPPKAHPRPAPLRHAPARPVASLAHTGADQTLPAIAGSAALVLSGAVLYRRFRPGAVR